MTDELTTPDPDMSAPESLADFDDAFEDWIAGASLTRRSVTIYGKPHLAAEHDRLTAEYDRLHDEDVIDGSLVGNPRLSEINARMVEILAEWEASKSEWIIEDVSPVADQISEEVGGAPAPVKPLVEPVLPRGASDAQKRTHTVAMKAHEAALPAHEAKVREYEKAAAAWSETYGLTMLSRAVVEVRFGDGRVQSDVTVEQLRRLVKAVGARQVNRLQAAVQEAMLTEPVISGPFSRSDSTDIPE